MSSGPSGDDFADDTGTGGQVAVGGSVQGSIEWEDDVDWFGVELTAGVRYELKLTGSKDSREYPVFGDYIWDGNGNPYARWSGDSAITDDDNTIDNGFFTPEESGTYYIPVEGGSYDSFWHGNNTRNDYWDEALSYTLLVAEAPAATPEGDYTADTSTMGVVDVDSPAAYSEIDSDGDVDWYAVELDSEKRYAFVLTPDLWSEDSLPWGKIVGLYDSDGELIANSSSDDQSSDGLNAVLTWQPGTSGTHYVAVAGTGTRDTGAYRLAVNELPEDDMSADAQTSGTLSVGGSSTGIIEMFGDVDWLAVELEAGQAYTFDVDGRLIFPVAWGSMEDLFDAETGWPLPLFGSFSLEGLYDGNGARVAAGGDSVTYTPSEDATYYVAVQGGGWNPIGHYEVTAGEVPDAI